ncbi:MAG: GTPase RsgA [Comamonadaceae bacterium]|nr:GTPase RsgA [Comamonadaceae bacterium]
MHEHAFRSAAADRLYSRARRAPSTRRRSHRAWPARVTEVQRETVALDDGAAAVARARCTRTWPTPLGGSATLAVGDWVAAARDAHGDAWVHAALPPADAIVAPRQPTAGARCWSATSTSRCIVMGLDGDFNPRRVERYLALVQGARRLAGDRADQGSTAPREPRAARSTRCAAGCRAACRSRPVDATLGRMRRRMLAPYLGAGQTAVLLGSSGAGKSTLTNTLLGRGGAGHRRGARATTRRGRHTTDRALAAPAARRRLPDRHAGPARACASTSTRRSWRRASPTSPRSRRACRFRDCRHRRRARLRGARRRGCRPAAELPQARRARSRRERDDVAARAAGAQLRGRVESARGRAAEQRMTRSASAA